MHPNQTAIEQAHELLDRLPDETDWQKIAYHMEVRASIERGLADVAAGRVFSTEEVKRRLGIAE